VPPALVIALMAVAVSVSILAEAAFVPSLPSSRVCSKEIELLLTPICVVSQDIADATL
jgi:hypothetical protein